MTKTIGRSRENVSSSTAMRLVQLAGRGAGAPGAPTAPGLGLGRRELGQQRDERRPPGADGLEHALGADVGDERAQRAS